jgi:hypothetical protein
LERNVGKREIMEKSVDASNQHFVHGRHQGDLFVGLEKYRLVFDLTFSRRY